jgi:hypothetical protein
MAFIDFAFAFLLFGTGVLAIASALLLLKELFK